MMEPLTENKKAMAVLLTKTMQAILEGIEKHCKSFCELAGSSAVPLTHIQSLHKIAMQPFLEQFEEPKEVKPIDPDEDLGTAKAPQ